MSPATATDLEQALAGGNSFVDDGARTAHRLALARGISVRLHRFFSRTDGRTLFVAVDRPRTGRRVYGLTTLDGAARFLAAVRLAALPALVLRRPTGSDAQPMWWRTAGAPGSPSYGDAKEI